MIKSGDKSLFLNELDGVVPLPENEKADLKKLAEDAQTIEERRRQAVAETWQDNNYLSSGFNKDDVILVNAYDILSFKRDGVQNGVFRKLKQGKYFSDTRLDLHRMTVEMARLEVFEFIQESMHYGLREVMIVHGRGLHKSLHTLSSSEQMATALLKSYVNKWLQEIPEVQAFHSAKKNHGGAGAVYILLKKSEQKKEENRQRFMAGRDKLP